MPIIAMYAAPELDKIELPDYFAPICAAWVMAFTDGDGDNEETMYCVETRRPRGCKAEFIDIGQYWGGRNATADLATAMAHYANLITAIKANQEYFAARDSATEHYAMS